MKKLITLILALCLAVSCMSTFASCKKGGNNSSSSSSDPAVTTYTVTYYNIKDDGSTESIGTESVKEGEFATGSVSGYTANSDLYLSVADYNADNDDDDENDPEAFDITKYGITAATSVYAKWIKLGELAGGTGHTYNTATTVSPSNWNELTYQDNNDTQIMSHLAGGFFTYDFKFDGNGDIIDGEYEVKYDFVTNLVDVTEEFSKKAFDEEESFGIGFEWVDIDFEDYDDQDPYMRALTPNQWSLATYGVDFATLAAANKFEVEDLLQYFGIECGVDEIGCYQAAVFEDSGKAYKLTFRHDGKWDDGTPIKAEDFVYSMKEQLSPLFFNYRADTYYNNSVKIHNAKNYLYQGQKLFEVATDVSSDYEDIPADPAAWAEAGLYFDSANVGAWVACGYDADLLLNINPKYLIGADGVDYTDVLTTHAGEDRVPMSQEIYDALYQLIIGDLGGAIGWGWGETEIGYFSVIESEYPAVDFSKVGLFVDPNDEYSLYIVLDEAMELLDADGNLTYHCGYDFGSLPLVHKAKYEASKKEPATGSNLWTSNYNTSVATSASWGPYKLTQFQSGKSYTLEKNPNWYGWNMTENQGKYETDKIYCLTVPKYETQWLLFVAGQLDGIGLDVTKAPDYKSSARAVFTPDDYVNSLQLQSDKEELKKRESDGVNKTLLTYKDFRKAISLAINRADYAAKNTTSSLAGFGLFNSMHYYDVANGGVYRNTDYARQVLCDVYAVDPADYDDDLIAATKAITGYDLEEAKVCLERAVAAAKEAGDYHDGDKVVLTMATSDCSTESFQRIVKFYNDALVELAKGTVLEGKLNVEVGGDQGTAWAENFRAGKYDICAGGWTGAAWNPGYFLMAYLAPAYAYAQKWDTSTHMLTATFKGINAKGVPTNNPDDEFTAELPLYSDNPTTTNWWTLLNSSWLEGKLDNEFRLPVIAAIEKEILSQYYTVPVTYSFTAELVPFKFDYFTTEYNTFCGYGGIKYLHYNYNDDEWKSFVQSKGGDLSDEYKKSAE